MEEMWSRGRRFGAFYLILLPPRTPTSSAFLYSLFFCLLVYYV
ncbi:hypothetical protein SSAG_03673 [Streptomyces sp. Mg1]|nr:hypothetical protein SSAG_03673 [Streptomyces sp. Mg1]